MPEGVSTGEPLRDDVSALLRAWTDGDQRALARLTPMVYDELHRLAHYYLKREQAGHSLQTTALVNEAYLRLVDYTRMQWQDRAHFLAVSAQAMRRILVDHARRRNVKRGADVEHVSLDEAVVIGPDRSSDFVSLDDALNALPAAWRECLILREVETLSYKEMAQIMDVPIGTVMSRLSRARRALQQAVVRDELWVGNRSSKHCHSSHPVESS